MLVVFEKGQVIVNHNKFMGYTKNEKDELVIVPEEAEIVRTVFRLYLEGYSVAKISEYLQEKGIRTTTGKEKWHANVAMKMLRNEKYIGDALLQKTYNGKKKIVWRCSNRLKHGKRNCQKSESIEEKVLHSAIMKAIDREIADAEELMRAGKDNILYLTGNYSRENAEKIMEDNDDWKRGFENYYVIKYIEKMEVDSDKKLTIWFKSGSMAEQQLKNV